jgi:hypothetical protein
MFFANGRYDLVQPVRGPNPDEFQSLPTRLDDPVLLPDTGQISSLPLPSINREQPLAKKGGGNVWTRKKVLILLSIILMVLGALWGFRRCRCNRQ